jgi:heme A synthase
MIRRSRFATFAWALLAYNLLVILWGAYVRASGSGAGCGAHWPLCNGVVIPVSPAIETIIEFTHRIMSGLVLVSVIVLVVWAWRKYPARNPIRWSASLAFVLTITEALVGAGLVLFELVAENSSVARAYWMMAHLTNTFLLLAALTITALWSTYGAPEQFRWRASIGIPLVIGIVLTIVLGASGAVTALGDTLFPASSLAEGLRQDFSETAHFLTRLRIWHPVIAFTVGAYLTAVSVWIRRLLKDRAVHSLSNMLIGLFLFQLFLGVLNVLLLAPIFMQLIHLLTADLVWITLVMFASVTFGTVGVAQGALDHSVHNRVNQVAH